MTLKWTARIVVLALLVVAEAMLKEITEAHEIESGVVGTYRAITLLLVYYIFWLLTRRVGGGASAPTKPSENQQTLSQLAVATFALFVCIAITSGFLAAHFVYVSAIEQSVGKRLALVFGFVAYMAGAATVLWTLDRLTKATT